MVKSRAQTENVKSGIKTLKAGLFLLFLIIFIGVVGFVYIEDYSFVEAVFMTVITLSTVGFREVRNLSPPGMVFTSLLIVTSFGLFAYVITSITRFILGGGFRNYYKTHLVNKKIEKLTQHVIVCGYGRNGRQTAEELLLYDEKVVVIENNLQTIEQAKLIHKNVVFLQGDATQDEVLERAKILQAKALVTTLPSDANNLFIVLSARQVNEKLVIVSRASEEHSDVKLRRAGATNVIMPDKIGGARMAKLVAQPDIIEFLETLLIRSQEQVNLVEIFCDEINTRFINKTIAELDIRRTSGANLIGLKTAAGELIFNPSPKHIIHRDDKLFTLGTPEQIEKLKIILKGVV